MIKKIPEKSIEETLDMLKGNWVMEPQNEVEPQERQYKGNTLKEPVWIYPDISKEENEKRIENLLDVMASIVVYNVNNGIYIKDNEDEEN
jgi:hypothetical protein